MDILKRLMNILTIIWIVFIALAMFIGIYGGVPLDKWINAIIEMIIDDPHIGIPVYLGGLIILFLNYILFHKITLWNKT